MPDSSAVPEHLEKLLASSIENVERLDVLLYLRAHRERTFGARAIAQAIGCTVVRAENHLAILCGRGFLTVSISVDLLYGYQPVSASVDVALKEVEDLNRQNRAALVALLGKQIARDPAHTFANAFLLRKPEKKGEP